MYIAYLPTEDKRKDKGSDKDPFLSLFLSLSSSFLFDFWWFVLLSSSLCGVPGAHVFSRVNGHSVEL
jgi:hypothetical protein